MLPRRKMIRLDKPYTNRCVSSRKYYILDSIFSNWLCFKACISRPSSKVALLHYIVDDWSFPFWIFVISMTYCFTSAVMLSMFVNVHQYHSYARELRGQKSTSSRKLIISQFHHFYIFLPRKFLLWRVPWCGTLKRIVWFFEEGSVVLWIWWCGTL